jgi:hypothetical protein
MRDAARRSPCVNRCSPLCASASSAISVARYRSNTWAAGRPLEPSNANLPACSLRQIHHEPRRHQPNVNLTSNWQQRTFTQVRIQ